MTRIGYTLSSEEFGPRELVALARRAEAAGFGFAGISDHFHPWIDRQGQSPFVWGTLGAVAQATERLEVFTGVTCPLIRYHPAIVAQAAATAAALMPGRFALGVGTGENLNEHVVGARWPRPAERLEMLEEAVGIIRRLWEGGLVSHDGRWYTVSEARLYTLPEAPPPLLVAAVGDTAARLAGRLGDGLVSTAPDARVVRAFEAGGGAGKPRYGQVHVCWAPDEQAARRTAQEHWPNSALPGQLNVELPLPRHFEQAAQMLSEDAVAGSVVCGPDPERHLAAIRAFEEAGFDHVYVHQVGPDQVGFLRFYEREVLPEFQRAPTA